MEALQLRIQSRFEDMAKVEKLIDEVCERYNIDEDFYGNILVALTEAVNNAMQHGNKLDVSKGVNIELNSDGGELSFKIKDEGSGFDFENIPDPTEPENLENPHGRGVFLMKSLADSVEFLDKGSTVEIKFKL